LPDVEQLQTLTRRLEALEQMMTQERNRLKPAPLLLQAEIEAHIQFLQTQGNALEKQVQAQMQSSSSLSQKLSLVTRIVEIGVASAAHSRAEIGALEQLDSA
jgi:transposase